MKTTSLFWLILLFAALLRYNSPIQAEEKIIVPDGLEHAIGGLELLDGKIPLLKMEDGVYPLRYFLGCSLLTVPFYALFGKEIGNAVYATLFFSLLSLVLLYLISKKLFGLTAAFFSLTVMTISPLHRDLSIRINSDVPFLVFVLLATLYYLEGKMSSWYGFLLGNLIGFSIWIRYQGLILIPSFILIFFMDQKKTVLEKAKCIGGFLLSVGLWLIPMGLYHHFLFGSVFRTGYGFWRPSRWAHLEKSFSWKYAFVKPALFGEEGNAVHYLKLMLGWNPSIFKQAYPFLVFIFFIWAALRIKRRGLPLQQKFLLFSIILIGAFFLGSSVLFAPQERYLIVPLFLIVIFSGEGARLLLQKVGKDGNFFLGTLAFFYILYITSPFLSFYWVRRPRPTRELVYLLNGIDEKRSIITGLNPVSFEYYVGSRGTFHYLPISQRIQYLNSELSSPGQEKYPFQHLNPIPEGYLRRIQKGEVLYLESYFSPRYKTEYRVLWHYCHVQRDQKEGSVSLYRLSKFEGM